MAGLPDSAGLQREVLAVKASTAAMLDTLAQCIDAMTSREEVCVCMCVCVCVCACVCQQS
jgi:hypothetical protein